MRLGSLRNLIGGTPNIVVRNDCRLYPIQIRDTLQYQLPFLRREATSNMIAIRRQAIHTTISVVLIVLGMTTAAVLATQLDQPPSFALELIIFLAGSVGGVANNYRRLVNIPLKVIADQNPITKQLITFQTYVSPIVGGIFSIVLYLLFMSGILQGTFFPVFSHVLQEGYVSFKLFAHGANPATNQDAAKAILWAFIAGFSEGLVPNFIDKIAQETSDKDEPKDDKPDEPRMVNI